MRKRGSFFVPLLCAAGIVILIYGLIELNAMRSVYNDYAIREDIGSKQGDVLAAIEEGERIIAYVRDASTLAQRQPAFTASCGEPYGTTKLLSAGACQARLEQDFKAAIGPYLAAYPGGSLLDIRWSATQDGASVRFTGTKRVPLGDRFRTGGTRGTLPGTLLEWPTSSVEIDSLFGNRDVPGGTKNHPGIDVDTPSTQPGDPVFSLTAGEATFTPLGQNSYITVRSGELEYRYMHVDPLPHVRAGANVNAREQIGTSAAYSGGTHLHLEVLYLGLTGATAEQSWGDHAGPSTEKTPASPSYAVVKSSTGPAYLNPVCFFERSFITGVLESSKQSAKLNVPANVFEACDAYAALPGLAEQLGRDPAASQAQAAAQQPNPTSSPVVSGSQTQDPRLDPTTSTASLSDDEQANMRLTISNIQKHDIASRLTEAAQKNDVPRELLLGVITQESRGDPSLVSDTGAAGIAQFTAATANEPAFADSFKQITSCCTEEQAAQRVCKQVAACTPSNDDRFDAEKSIKAAGVYLGSLYKHYEGYDHQLAFAIAAYNGGQGRIDKAVELAGSSKPGPNWQNVQAQLQAAGATPAKATEIRDYVTKVTKYYEAWGGATFIDTSFTSDEIGYYDVYFALEVKPSPIQRALQSIQGQLAACKDAACIENAVALTADRHGLIAQKIDLTQPSACLTEIERAGMYFESQVLHCLRSPDNACGCELGSELHASYDVSAGTSTIVELNAEKLERTETIDLHGLALRDDADANAFSVQVLPRGRHDTTGTVVLDGGTARLNFGGIIGEPVERFYKLPEGLAFTAKPLEACVAAPAPVPYCLMEKASRAVSAVIWVDMAAHSEPQATLEQRFAALELTSTRIIISSDESLPFVHVTLGDGVAAQHYYLRAEDARVLDPTGVLGSFTSYDEIAVRRDMAQSLALSYLQGQTLPQTGFTYEFVVPHDGTAPLAVTLMDENLRETSTLDLDVNMHSPNPFNLDPSSLLNSP